MSDDTLASRVGQLLRGYRHLPQPLTEREALDRLRPLGSVGFVLPADSPLNQRGPQALSEPEGGRDELLVHEDSTG